MENLKQVSDIVNEFQNFTKCNETPTFDNRIVRFGPKKNYWFTSYNHGDWYEIITGSWDGSFEETRFNLKNKEEVDLVEIRKNVSKIINSENEKRQQETKEQSQKHYTTLGTGTNDYITRKRITPYNSKIEDKNLLS